MKDTTIELFGKAAIVGLIFGSVWAMTRPVDAEPDITPASEDPAMPRYWHRADMPDGTVCYRYGKGVSCDFSRRQP